MRCGGSGFKREWLGSEFGSGESGRHFLFLIGSECGGGGKERKWEVKTGRGK